MLQKHVKFTKKRIKGIEKKNYLTSLLDLSNFSFYIQKSLKIKGSRYTKLVCQIQWVPCYCIHLFRFLIFSANTIAFIVSFPFENDPRINVLFSTCVKHNPFQTENENCQLQNNVRHDWWISQTTIWEAFLNSSFFYPFCL